MASVCYTFQISVSNTDLFLLNSKLKYSTTELPKTSTGLDGLGSVSNGTMNTHP